MKMNDEEIKVIEALTKEISILNRLFAFYLQKTLCHPGEIINTKIAKEWVEDAINIYTGEKPLPCDNDCPEDCNGEHYISTTFTDIFKITTKNG